MKRGFRITMVMADSEFAPLQTLLSELHEALTLNLTAANKHELLVECRIHVIKEQMRVVCHLLPFNTLPRKMTANVILCMTKLLNHFPMKGGLLSMTLSPKMVMSGETINYKHNMLPFGSYCQDHKETAPHNRLAACTQGAILLGPSGNMQGAQ
jgi:hypothetical protein